MASSSSSSSSAGPVVDRIFMVHSLALAQTRSVSLKLMDERIAPMSRLGIVMRVLDDEPEAITVDRLAGLADTDPSHVDDATFRPLVCNMHIRQLSNTLKHAAALKAVAKDSVGEDDDNGKGKGNNNGKGKAGGPHRFSLVVEDDALFGQNIASTLRGACTLAPQDAGIVFLGLPSPVSAPTQEGVSVFDDAVERFQVLPACDSYLVTPAAAAALSEHMHPVRFPTNVQLTYAIRRAGIRAYLAVPNVFVDGSKLGVFACSLDPNNKLVWNQSFCKLDALVRSPQTYATHARAHADAQVAQCLAEQPFKEHPDVLALKAMHEVNMGRFGAAEAVYADALAKYDQAGALVTNASEFLRGYVALHRELQQQA